MKVGIIADTHDNIVAIQKAVQYFNSRAVDYVLHAGDFVAPFSLKELVKVKSRLLGVFGNNDGERKGLLYIYRHIYESPFNIILEGRHIIVTHMLESISKRSKMNTDVIISAHTHVAEIIHGSPMYINPGECGGWVNKKSTVAVLDLETLHTEIIDLSTVFLKED